MNHGISILQGPHQVAQKSRMTTLPLNAARPTSLFWRSFSVKSSFAGFALAGHAAPAGAPRSMSVVCHGSAFNVRTARPSALTAAAAHLRYIATPNEPKPASTLLAVRPADAARAHSRQKGGRRRT